MASRLATIASSSGAASRYQYVEAGSTWPSAAESAGSLASTSSRYQLTTLATANECLLWGIPHNRHSFAVASVVNWYREDVDAKLPALSAALGHVDPASTYWYLEAAPELLAIVAKRLATVLSELP